MNATFIFQALAGVGIAAVIATTGLQLFLSARTADAHLDRATDPAPMFAARANTNGFGTTDAADTSTASNQIFSQLQNYYAANIKQGTTIFWATLLAMSIGFAIIFIGIISAGTNATIAIVATIAGVLSQFIAATFLVVLRSTQTQATTYAQTLVELRLREAARAADARSVDLGLRLLGEISGDRANPVNATKASIAMGLIVKAPRTVIESPIIDGTSTGVASESRARAATVTFDDTREPEHRSP